MKQKIWKHTLVMKKKREEKDEWLERKKDYNVKNERKEYNINDNKETLKWKNENLNLKKMI